MPPIYEVAGQLYVVPDVHLNEVVKHNHEHRHDYGPIAWTHPHEHEHQQGADEVHVHEHEVVKEDEDNGCCDCLLCIRLLVECYRILANLCNGNPPYSQGEICKMVTEPDDLIGRIYARLQTSGVEPDSIQVWEEEGE